jgi:hypothetical protein
MASLIPSNEPRSAIYTYKNTNFADWKVMMLAEAAAVKFDVTAVRPLTIKHGWENGETPDTFVKKEVHKLMRETRNAEVRRLND